MLSPSCTLLSGKESVRINLTLEAGEENLSRPCGVGCWILDAGV
jgi:hypothetical protein